MFSRIYRFISYHLIVSSVDIFVPKRILKERSLTADQRIEQNLQIGNKLIKIECFIHRFMLHIHSDILKNDFEIEKKSDDVNNKKNITFQNVYRKPL